MTFEITAGDKKQILDSLGTKYAQVASSPEGRFKYPTGSAALEKLNYDPQVIGLLPDSVKSSYCGVGNPFSLGHINKGESVLDVGCGAGVDALVAALMVGPEGKVAGVDLVPDMLTRAEQNLKEINLKNVSFHPASAEELPFPDDSFEVVISNGVLNLVVDKKQALSEIFRILKSGGRFMAADQVLLDSVRIENQDRVKSWFK